MDTRTPAQWRWRGRHIKLVDGTTILMPDTAENQALYPQHGSQKAGAGFPIARLVGVVSLAHGALLDVAMGPYQGKGTGEHALFRELLKCFAKGDIMLADSYYASYFLIAALMGMGVDFVFEQHGARHTDFRTGEKLGRRDHLVQWVRPARPQWMSPEEYDSFPAELTVRETKVGKKVLVTSFLNPREVCKREVGSLFLHRWNVELDLRNVKDTLGMAMLSCKSPEMCAKELWVYLLAYNLIRLLMAQAAVQAAVSPRQLSFKHAVQVWLAWSHKQFCRSPVPPLEGRARYGDNMEVRCPCCGTYCITGTIIAVLPHWELTDAQWCAIAYGLKRMTRRAEPPRLDRDVLQVLRDTASLPHPDEILDDFVVGARSGTRSI